MHERRHAFRQSPRRCCIVPGIKVDIGAEGRAVSVAGGARIATCAFGLGIALERGRNLRASMALALDGNSLRQPQLTSQAALRETKLTSTSRMIAPIAALMIWPPMPEKCKKPGNNTPATIAPRMPTIMLPTSPNPAPVKITPASHPATAPIVRILKLPVLKIAVNNTVFSRA